ncbi:MAG: hypothetical protein PHS42_03655 [Sulfurimonas sp.]|nr:hypothetical protein [Sulfurimonas sp.]MDD3834548.1 hypothetical protein [Sulfurimonas sp.]
MKKVRILEIDNNNNSNVFYNSQVVDSVSVKVEGAEEAFSDMMFEMMADDIRLVCDLGGGDDSKAGLKIISSSGIPFIYLIPIGNSLAQLQNAYDTYNMIGDPENTIFVLNQATSIEKAKEEFVFWYGSDKYGTEAFCDKIKNPKTIVVPRTPLFELAAMDGVTISELAQFGDGIEKADAMSLFFEKSGGDKEVFKNLKRKYDQSKLAREYLDGVLSQFKKLIKDTNCIAVASSKGGVGKSTISYHLAGLTLQD